MTKHRRPTRTTIKAKVLCSLCHLERNVVIGISKLCHLEPNKVIGEADDLVQSKDPNAVISANAASGSSPRDVDVSATRERPARFFGSSRGYGVLRLREIFTFVKFSLRSG